MERKENYDEFISYISGGELITAEKYYKEQERIARNKEIKKKLNEDRKNIEKMLQEAEKKRSEEQTIKEESKQIYQQKKQYDKIKDSSYSKVSVKRTPQKKESISKEKAKHKRKTTGVVITAIIASFMMAKTINAISGAGENLALYNQGKEYLETVAAENLEQVGIISIDENGVKTIIDEDNDYTNNIRVDNLTPAAVDAYLSVINKANQENYDVSDKMIQTMYGHEIDENGRDVLTPYSNLEDYRTRENLLKNDAFSKAVYDEIIEAQKNGTLKNIVPELSQDVKGVKR